MFGNKFIMQDGSGRALVDPGPRGEDRTDRDQGRDRDGARPFRSRRHPGPTGRACRRPQRGVRAMDPRMDREMGPRTDRKDLKARKTVRVPIATDRRLRPRRANGATASRRHPPPPSDHWQSGRPSASAARTIETSVLKGQRSMPDHHTSNIAGTITHVFGHRFVVQTSEWRDSRRRNAERNRADRTACRRHRRAFGRSQAVRTEGNPLHAGRHDHHHRAQGQAPRPSSRRRSHARHCGPQKPPASQSVVSRTANRSISRCLGERDARFTELHIELDGRIRKMKPVNGHDPKWAHALGG